MSNSAVPGNITHLVAQQADPLTQSIARVAHEVSAATAMAFGDYSIPPWERLDDLDQTRVYGTVQMFMGSPGMHATAMLPMGAVLTDSARAAAFAFHGVVHAIAREQSRP